MPIVPLYGHAALRRRLRDTVTRAALPASLLIHGDRGIGKQRLALWLGQLLLCTGQGERPCDTCRSCRYARDLAHPDLRWFFPRPRLADAQVTAEQVLEDYTEALIDRAGRAGLYPAPSGTEAIYVMTVRAIVHLAAYTPTLGARKVFVIGDAERMVPQEGADAAANSFLKLLEEPPEDTTLILTSSEPGALLPTIRSRVVAVRAARLPDDDVQAFLNDPSVAAMLKGSGVLDSVEHHVRLAAGAPGTLFGATTRSEALDSARALLAAVDAGRAERMRVAFLLGGSKARGFFSEMLDALTTLLHQRAVASTQRGDARRAVAAGRAIDAVETAKSRAAGNINPQLLGASLVRDLADILE